jgi:hypothetical protein
MTPEGLDPVAESMTTHVTPPAVEAEQISVILAQWACRAAYVSIWNNPGTPTGTR